MGDAGVKRAGGQFSRIFQRYLRRQRQIITDENDEECRFYGTVAEAIEVGRGRALL